MFAPKNTDIAARSAWMGFGLASLLALAACDDAGNFNPQDIFSAKPEIQSETATPQETTEFVEKDVEAPDLFFAKEAGLWDGRPSLGGVWVAHPDVDQPERVMIRNNTNGQFVVGALFRRERANPGPRLQLSSDAAQAIGVIAGAPVELEVVALKKEKIAVEPPEPVVEDAIEEPSEIQESTLDPIAAAGAAIETAPPTQVETEAVAAAAAAASTPSIESTLPISSLDKPFIQVGIFNVEANAEEASNQMSRAGLSPIVREEGSSAQPSWRVVVGPAGSTEELQAMLGKVKSAGFSDAYLVSN